MKTATEGEQSDLKTITNILKITGSLQMELIPGSDNHLNKKTFDWTINEYNENALKFHVEFDHPEYMSI